MAKKRMLIINVHELTLNPTSLYKILLLGTEMNEVESRKDEPMQQNDNQDEGVVFGPKPRRGRPPLFTRNSLHLLNVRLIS